MEDTMEILGNGITCAFYTLEPPDVKQRHNPYQKQIYGPNCISRTRYLATLLGADYLLKMFSTGTEVNDDYPFKFRRFNHGIDYINPVKGMGGQVTRFWIEPKELEYTQSTDGDVITILFSDVMMTIKHHEMHYDEDGNLVDDDLESHDSANSRFARTLTENYDQISRHYPILARLKPLLKLGLIINIINNIYENVKANNEHDYDDGLTKIKNELKDYPLYSSNKVESEIDKLCNQQGLSKYKISN